ncbi:MAG: protein kinase [bacterium]|nr:protein kinase [bacterium]
MLGQRLSDRYEIVDELGRGGMGVVYRARDPRLDRDVAIKLIAPALLTPVTEERFKTEALVVAQMDHPAIVPIYDVGHHEGSLFFVMPVVAGSSLKDLIHDDRPRLGDVLEVAIQVAEALEYSHARGIVHRDIKPENVMVQRGGDPLRVRVMDFGLARHTKVSGLTKTGMVIGTLRYVSPEQLMGKSTDGRSDIYSLGVTLYECLTREVPFTGDLQEMLYRIAHEEPRSPRSLGADIDDRLEAIILSCLQKDAGSRPQTASELVRGLHAYRASLRDSEKLRSIVGLRSVELPRPQGTPFIGRKDELRLLQQRLNDALDGECQFVVISGESGVGKTRMLEELENLARARHIRVLHGRFVEHDATFPYYGFCEAIQEFFRRKELGTSHPSALPDLSDLASDLISLFPMLSEIPAIGGGAASSPEVAARSPAKLEDGTQIFELLARTLIRLAAGRPLVLLLEDLHGAEASIDALQYVVRRLGATPTLIVGTYRSTEVDRRHSLSRMLDGFQGDRRFQSIELQTMSADEHRELLASLVGGADVVKVLARQLYEASEGNPFFTKELVRSLRDAGSIVQDDTGSWNLSGGTDISSDALPATIGQAVEKRIGRLPEDLRKILCIASVMGKTFEYRDLETLTGSHGDLDDAVDRLVDEGLIEEDSRSRIDRLIFSSGVVRDVLYGELPRRKRRSLHRKYAQILEQRHADRLERAYSQLVHHFSEGDVPEMTVEYGLLHARQALEKFSSEEAVRSAKKALEFLDDEWEGDRALEGEARILLAEGHRHSGDLGGALKEMDAAIAVFERESRPERQVAVLLEAARIAWQARRTDEGRRWTERGIQLARDGGHRDELRQFLSLAATLANLRGDAALASEYLEEAEGLGAGARTDGAQEAVARGGRLSVALANPVIARAPAEIQLVEEAEVLSNVFELLLDTDEVGNLIPCLAERWEAREDGRSFHFKLRSGVKFHDGEPLDAATLKHSIEAAVREVAPNLPPAYSAIDGVQDWADGVVEELRGIVVHAEDALEIRLADPLPIYPALLSDTRAGVGRRVDAGGEKLAGTGPFRLCSHDERLIALERNDDYWKGTTANLDAIEFHHGRSAAAIAAGLRSGEFDLARDLLPEDLEDVLRDRRFRNGLVEATQKITYFALFNSKSSGAGQSAPLRRALSYVVRARDLVWRTLGRFAQPATGFIPAGIFAHDPGRRPHRITREEARELIRESGMGESPCLRASVHPLIQDRYQSLLQALFSVWEDVGVRVEVVEQDTAGFIKSFSENDGIDLMINRWVADYDDPDNFTHMLFHSDNGLFRAYYSSEEADETLEGARTATRPEVRLSLYRRFENLLFGGGHMLPLLQDVDYRVANPRVQAIRLGSVSPYVNYTDLGRAPTEQPSSVQTPDATGVLVVPMTSDIDGLDPTLGLSGEHDEILPNVYETLTRDVGEARIVPWLAAEFHAERGGAAYRFRLRENVLFHDGRRLTARDVRHSFERLLLNSESQSRWQYSVIRGADDLLNGRSRQLAGFHIESAGEFTIELERPVSFFPGLLAFRAASILPEGTAAIGADWTEGAVGSGPFRIARFEPGKRLDLERNTGYWRGGLPRSQGLSFSFGLSPKEILSGFRSGRYSLAADLFPEDVDNLRRESRFAAGFRETPRLSTFYLAFNTHRGPLKDMNLRRRVLDALDVGKLVRHGLGHLATPAHGLIPPGLLGSEPLHSQETSWPRRADTAVDVELTAAIHPVFTREYSRFFDRLQDALIDAGVTIRPTTETMGDLLESRKQTTVDLALVQWVADYPDADSFVQILQSERGFIGPLCGSSEVDRLINRGRGEKDSPARHAIYRQVEELIAREARLLPLFHEQVYRFARPEIEGLNVSYWYPVVAYEQLRIRPT